VTSSVRNGTAIFGDRASSPAWVLGLGDRGSLIDAGLQSPASMKSARTQARTLTTSRSGACSGALLGYWLFFSRSPPQRAQAPVGNARQWAAADSSPWPTPAGQQKHERGKPPPGLPRCQAWESSKAQQSNGVMPQAQGR